MSEVKVDSIGPRVDNGTLTIGASGDTVNIAGTAGTGFPTPTSGIAASAIDSGTIATARLGSGTASSSTFLRGDQTYAAAGGENTPAFSSYLAFNSSQNISDNTLTKVNLNTEHFDTDSTFDTSTYRFTCPSGGAGKYLFSWQIYLYGADTASNIQYANAFLYKNGSVYNGTDQDCRDNEQRALVLGNSVILDVAVADYFELYGRIKVNSGTPSFFSPNRMTYFSGMRLIT